MQGDCVGGTWVVRARDDGILDEVAACRGEKQVDSDGTWEVQAAGLGDNRRVVGPGAGTCPGSLQAVGTGWRVSEAHSVGRGQPTL